MMATENLMFQLDDMNETGDGEEMVVIAAEDGMDLAALQAILSGGIDNSQGQVYQIAESSDLQDTVVLTPEQFQQLTGGSGTNILQQGMPNSLNSNFITSQTIEPPGITYRCPSCPQHYQNANAFTKHMREKHFVKVYTCRQCDQFYETLSQLFLHARRTHVDPKKPKKNPGTYKFHCPDCSYMTNNGGTMEHHRRAHTGVKPFSCDICGKHFAQKANMKTHRNRHVHKERIFHCETCTKAFNSYDIYLAHLRTREHELREHFQMIATSKLNIQCVGCSDIFDNMYALNKHCRGCKPVKAMSQNKYCCRTCEAFFDDTKTLKTHLKAHEGDRIISCPVCGERGFPGFNQLNHHITRAHALKVNRRHVCRYCESTFENKKDLDSHIIDMHSEERNARQSRGAVGRLKCRYDICEFTTNSVMLLDRHHKQHLQQDYDGNLGAVYRPRKPKPRRVDHGMEIYRKKSQYTSRMDTYDEDDDFLEPDDFMELLPDDDDEEEETANEHDDLNEDEEEDDDDCPEPLVDPETNVTRKTITLVKSKNKNKYEDHQKMVYAGTQDMQVAQELTLSHQDQMNSAIINDFNLPSSSGAGRNKRLPVWLNGPQDEANKPDELANIELPEGMVLEDRAPVQVKQETEDEDIKTEEWNIIVYDDDDEEDD